MNLAKLNILFLIAKNRIRQDGKAPIFCRLTLHKKRKQFSTGYFIKPDTWNNKKQLVKPPNEENTFLNKELSLIKQKINQAFLFLQVNEEVFDVNDVYLQYKGHNTSARKTLLEVFQLHNTRMQKLIGKEYSKSTHHKFIEAKKHTANFIKFEYGKNDILLDSLKMSFLKDFDFYLKSELNHKQITINKSIQRVRKIIKLALAEGYLLKDPFILYQSKRYEKKVVYLTQAELKQLEEYQFAQQRLEQVRDMFVFCCYTGLAYREMSDLKPKHLIKGYDGNIWIEMMRKKTKTSLSIPLLPVAERILNKYKSETSLLPIISNQKFNSYIKEIAEIIGIEKRLTHHIARKTFATTVLLYNDVPMEIVSELLGHSKITITQDHYAKVVQKKVGESIEKLKIKLKGSV